MYHGLSSGREEPRHHLGATFLKSKPEKPLNCFSAARSKVTIHNYRQVQPWLQIQQVQGQWAGQWSKLAPALTILCLRPLCFHHHSWVFYYLKAWSKQTPLSLKEGNENHFQEKWKKERIKKKQTILLLLLLHWKEAEITVQFYLSTTSVEPGSLQSLY